MKYGPEITAEITDLLRKGSNRTDACAIADINFDTFCEWMKKHAEFSEAVKKAEAECKQRNITIIQKAAITTWQAAAWWLERKHRDEFALKPNQITINQQDTTKQSVEAAMNALKMMEEASRNAASHHRNRSGSDPVRVEDRPIGLQTQSPAAHGL